MSDSTHGKRKYNAKSYKSFILRVRRDSALLRHMEKYAETAEVSISFLLTRLLCDYFGCGFPHRRYVRRRIIRVIYQQEDDE